MVFRTVFASISIKYRKFRRLPLREFPGFQSELGISVCQCTFCRKTQEWPGPSLGPVLLKGDQRQTRPGPLFWGGFMCLMGVSREQRRWLNRSDSLFWRGAPVDDQGARGKALKHLNQVENADAAGRRLPQPPGVQTSRPPETSRGPIRSTNKKGACCFFSRVRSRLVAGSFDSLCSRFDCSVVPSGHPFGFFRLDARKLVGAGCKPK